MKKSNAFLATVVLALLPTVSFATCFGEKHEQVTMSCSEGTVWDGQTQTCVPSTS